MSHFHLVEGHRGDSQRRVRGGTKVSCYVKENQSEFSETRRLKDLVKKHSEFNARSGADLRRRLFADEAHVPGACPRANRRTDHRCASATAEFGWIDEQIIEVLPLPILEETVAVMKLVPHEHTKTTQKIAEFPQPKFINEVVDDRVMA